MILNKKESLRLLQAMKENEKGNYYNGLKACKKQLIYLAKHENNKRDVFREIMKWLNKEENNRILRGRDDLNSNKTPKEFCKDKERNWVYALNGDD